MLRAFAIAAALSALLAASVTVAFSASRAKLLQTPIDAVSGAAALPATPPASASPIEAPFAVIARIHNEDGSPQAFTIRLNRTVVCTRTVAGGRTQRIDCSSPVAWDGTPPAVVITSEASARWTLEYLEFATHHGATQDYDLVIVPRGSRAYAPVPLPAVALAFFVLFALFLVPGVLPDRFHLVAVHRAAAAAVTIFLALVFAAPYVTQYTVLLSVNKFFWCCAVLAAPRIWFLYLVSAKRLAGAGLARPALGTIAVLLTLVCYGSVGARRLSQTYEGNFSGFLQIARATFDRDPTFAGRDDVRQSLVLRDEGGYDGEYMYFAVYDPFLWHFRNNVSVYRGYIDAVPYRYGRIGYIWLTKIVSLDQWRLYPAAMMTIVFTSILVCAALLAAVAAGYGLSPLWGAGVVLVPGFWQSLQTGLPEPLAAALLLGGFLLLRRRHVWWAAALFASSLLVRETGAIFIVAVAAFTPAGATRARRAAFLACAAAPVVLWHFYVGAVLLPGWGPRVFLLPPGPMEAPFVGIADLWKAMRNGLPLDAGVHRAAIFYPLLLMFGAGLAGVLSASAWCAAAAAAVGYGAMALSFDFNYVWLSVMNAQRITFELFICLLLATFELRSRGRRAPWWLAATFWGATALYVFWGTFDAPFIRAGLRFF
jgi:hypothetical protein